jgi:hypothetical protein
MFRAHNSGGADTQTGAGNASLCRLFSWPNDMTASMRDAGSAPAGVSAGWSLRLPRRGGEAGAALTAHPAVRKFLFTGSVETGKAVLRAAAATVKNVGMELGGNDAALVLRDAPIGPELIRELIVGVFGMSGQVCYGIKRIYVDASRLADFTGAFTDMAARIVVGDGLDPRSKIGPVIPVLPFADEDEAVQLANDTEFGLGAPSSRSSRPTSGAPTCSAAIPSSAGSRPTCPSSSTRAVAISPATPTSPARSCTPRWPDWPARPDGPWAALTPATWSASSRTRRSTAPTSSPTSPPARTSPRAVGGG